MHRCLLVVLLLPGALVLAQKDRKGKPDDAPRVLVAVPPGIAPGTTTRVVLRGQKLEQAREVRLGPKGTARLLEKRKVNVPNQQEPARTGDSEAHAELTVPADVPGDAVEVVVVTPAGTSRPHRVLLDRTPPVLEKEPNDGFTQAQPISLGQTVQGTVARPQDVDVYRFEGKVGQKVIVEVHAARLGALLDVFLSLHDAGGQVLGQCDDLADSPDARLEATLPRTGTYHVSVTDAHDLGGPTHVYRLTVRGK